MTHSNSQRVGGRAGVEINTDQHRGREREGAGGSVLRSFLFTLVFLSRSDAGVCRLAWRLSRCGLRHQDHYRQSRASESNRARSNLTLFVSQQIRFSCCHLELAAFVTKKSGIISEKEEATLPSNIQSTVNQCACVCGKELKVGGWYRHCLEQCRKGEKGLGSLSFFLFYERCPGQEAG